MNHQHILNPKTNRRVKVPMVGQVYGTWTVVEVRVTKRKALYRCKCGKEKWDSCGAVFGNHSGQTCRSCSKKLPDDQLHKNAPDLTGQKFGKWEVVGREFLRFDNGTRRLKWRTRCECGFEKLFSGRDFAIIVKGGCKSCRIDPRKKDAFHKHIDGAWARAKKHKREFDIDEKFMRELFEQQQSKCAISGLTISVSDSCGGFSKGKSTASIDRIDSNKGYTKDNVQWVHKFINQIKWDLDLSSFIWICHQIVKLHPTEPKLEQGVLSKLRSLRAKQMRTRSAKK